MPLKPISLNNENEIKNLQAIANLEDELIISTSGLTYSLQDILSLENNENNQEIFFITKKEGKKISSLHLAELKEAAAKNLLLNNQVLSEFLKSAVDPICPISFEPILFPVITIHGQTYEASQLQEWLRDKASCPLTRQALNRRDVFPNVALEQALWLSYILRAQKLGNNAEKMNLLAACQKQLNTLATEAIDIHSHQKKLTELLEKHDMLKGLSSEDARNQRSVLKEERDKITLTHRRRKDNLKFVATVAMMIGACTIISFMSGIGGLLLLGGFIVGGTAICLASFKVVDFIFGKKIKHIDENAAALNELNQLLTGPMIAQAQEVNSIRAKQFSQYKLILNPPTPRKPANKVGVRVAVKNLFTTKPVVTRNRELKENSNRVYSGKRL